MMRPTILIADDDRLTREIIHEVILMRHSDWRIVCAGSGADTVAYARRLRPNLILLNSHLPPTPCDEIAALLHSSLSTYDIPLVLMNDDATDETRPEHRWYCAQLEKPFGLHDLYDVLDRFVLQRNVATLCKRPPASGFHPLAPQWLSTLPAQGPYPVRPSSLFLPASAEEIRIHDCKQFPPPPCQDASPATVSYPL